MCLTGDKLYGFWDAGGIEWAAAIDEWVAREPDVGSELHTLAGHPVRRLFATPPHVGEVPNLITVPGREELDELLRVAARRRRRGRRRRPPKRGAGLNGGLG